MKSFVDTNVLVYLADGSDPRKRDIARELVLDPSHCFVVSAQVMGELFVTLRRKLGVVSDADIVEQVASFEPRCLVSIDRDLVSRAIETSLTAQLSYGDALIVESAAEAGCDRLATEDLQHGAVIRGVEIWNPFADLA